MKQEKKNIVLIVMDTARARSFSCYGCENETTPFLDRMAEKNVKYEHAISQTNWTLPPHCLVRGQYEEDFRRFEGKKGKFS